MSAGTSAGTTGPPDIARFDGYRQPGNRYYTYQANFHSTDNLKAVVCLNVDRPGFFRVSLGATEPVRFPLNLVELMGVNPLPQSTFEMIFQPAELVMQENSWHSQWFSFQDRLNGNLVVVETSNKSAVEAREEAKLLLNKPELQLSFRFEVIVPPNKASGLMLCVRCLPAKAVVLNENSRFTGHDVGGMTVETFVVSTTKMPDHCMDIKDFFPCGPVVFSEEPLSHADYRKTVLTDFPNLMIFCRVLANLTLNQCRDYIRDPKFPTGNKHRFDPSHKHSSNLPDDSTFSKSTDMTLDDDEEAEALLAATREIQDENSHKVQKVNQGLSVADHLRKKRLESVPPTTLPSVTNPNFQSVNSQSNCAVPSSSYNHSPLVANTTEDPHKFVSFSQNLTVGEAKLSREDLRTRYQNLSRQGRLDDIAWEALCYIPLAVLAQKELEATERMFTQPKSMEDKLDKNRTTVLQETLFKEEMDDLQTKLHSVRFSRMPVTSSQRLFQMSRDIIGSSITPINAYSFDHLRHSHRISTSAFLESHNLVSQKISLKLFTTGTFKKESEGVAKVRLSQNFGEDPECRSEPIYEDVKSLIEFFYSFFWAQTLRRRVFPLDCSMESLWLFLIENQFFVEKCNYKGLGRGPMDPGRFCSLFTDYCLRINNKRFQQREAHLATDEIAVIFEAFCLDDYRFKNHTLDNSRTSIQELFSPTASTASPSQQRSKPKSGKKTSPLRFNGLEMCFNFNNANGCTRRMIDDVHCVDDRNFKRFHGCTWVVNEKPCGQPHKKINHFASVKN